MKKFKCKIDFSKYEHGGVSVPSSTLYSLQLYTLYGIEPGGFLKAVLCNDLFRAMASADLTNMKGLPATVSFIYNKLPQQAWGSEKKMWDWMNKRRTDQWEVADEQLQEI